MVRLWRAFKALINGIWKIITLPCWLLTNFPNEFADPEKRKYALEVVKTLISALSLIATILAAIGLFVNYQDAVQNRLLTEERLITDRFAKAVEQIGNGKEEVVIGGIFSLGRIAKDSSKDQWTIMEVLTAFVRKNSSMPPIIKELHNTKDKRQILEKLEPVTIKVQAALTVIGRRNINKDNIQNSKFTKIINLSESNLKGVILREAHLNRANFKGSSLVDADLRGTNFYRTNFKNADLSDADLRGANLEGANLGYTEISYSQIKSTCFWDRAIYTNSVWNKKEKKLEPVDKQANQEKIKEIRQDKASAPENRPDCSKWETEK